MPAIQNGRGISRNTITSGRQDAYREGQPIGEGRDEVYSNPSLPQISTVTLAAVADVSDEIVAGQVWTFTFTSQFGDVITHTYTVTADDDTAGTDAAGLAYMATTLAASLASNSELDNVMNPTAAAAVMTFTFLHAGDAWTVTASCAPAVAETVLTSTVATSQTAGGTTLPMARFVTYGTPVPDGPGGPGRRASLPSASTDTIVGVSLADWSQVRPFTVGAAAINAYPVDSLVSVRERGHVAMTLAAGSPVVAGGPVYAVVSTSGGDLLGEARSTPDGTADVWTATPTATNDAVYGLSIHFPAWNGQDAQTHVVPPITADGSATATEICDALRASIATVPELVALLTTSGTATLILTGNDLGRPFTVYDSAEAGDFASITHTTTAAAYTTLVPRAYWAAPVAVGAIGSLYMDR